MECCAQPASPIELHHDTDMERAKFLHFFVFSIHFNSCWHFLGICSARYMHQLLSCSCLHHSRTEVKTLYSFPACRYPGLPGASAPCALLLAHDMSKVGCPVAHHANIFQHSASPLPHVMQTTSAANAPHLPLAIPVSFGSVLLSQSWGGGEEEGTCMLIIP